MYTRVSNTPLFPPGGVSSLWFTLEPTNRTRRRNARWNPLPPRSSLYFKPSSRLGSRVLLCLTGSFFFQEPGPAKVAVTGSGIPEAEKVPDSSSIIWQEELNQREAEGAAVWAAGDLPPGSPAGRKNKSLCIHNVLQNFDRRYQSSRVQPFRYFLDLYKMSENKSGVGLFVSRRACISGSGLRRRFSEW